MTIKKTLGTIAFAGLIGLTGCDNYEDKTGIVEKEYGNVTQIVESSGALFGNESVKFSNPTYILQIKTDEGIYIASILSRGNRKIESLAIALKEGDRVRFVVNNETGSTNFGSDRVGRLFADQIKILPKEDSTQTK